MFSKPTTSFYQKISEVLQIGGIHVAQFDLSAVIASWYEIEMLQQHWSCDMIIERKAVNVILR